MHMRGWVGERQEAVWMREGAGGNGLTMTGGMAPTTEPSQVLAST